MCIPLLYPSCGLVIFWIPQRCPPLKSPGQDNYCGYCDPFLTSYQDYFFQRDMSNNPDLLPVWSQDVVKHLRYRRSHPLPCSIHITSMKPLAAKQIMYTFLVFLLSFHLKYQKDCINVGLPLFKKYTMLSFWIQDLETFHLVIV